MPHVEGNRVGRWVMLAYRLPREPSTPRITIWRRLKRLGVIQLSDGVVALPLDSRTREALEWIADEVMESGGDSSIWIGEPTSAGQERALAARMAATVAAEYTDVINAASEASGAEVGSRRRTLARLRRQLHRARRRDYFPPAEREQAEAAIADLAASIDAEVAA